MLECSFGMFWYPFPVLFPVTEEAFEPMFGQQVYQLSYARLCKTLQDIQVESLGQERNHSQAPRHPHQSRHRWRLPVMHPEDHKWCRWHRSRPVRTRVSVSHLRHVLIYIYTCPTSSNLKSVQNGSDSADVKNQMNCLSTCRTWNHHEPKEVDRVDQWAKVKSGQVRSSQVEVNLQVNAQENQKHFI